MKEYKLSRQEKRAYQRNPGKLAEKIATAEYGYQRSGPPFDGKSSTGAVVEVKSAQKYLQSGDRGRFRLWDKQHRKLRRKANGKGGSYVFVFFDTDNRPLKAYMKRKRPAKIGRIIAGRGGFNKSGHRSRNKQHKLPWNIVFPEFE